MTNADPRAKYFPYRNQHFGKDIRICTFFPTKSDVLAKNIWTQLHNLTFTNFWTMILGPKI